jgi:hypothetical protein
MMATGHFKTGGKPATETSCTSKISKATDNTMQLAASNSNKVSYFERTRSVNYYTYLRACTSRRTSSMEHNPSSKANSRLASQDIFAFYVTRWSITMYIFGRGQ